MVAMLHTFKNGKCTDCGMSEAYADHTQAGCDVPGDHPDNIGVVPIMTNVVEPFDAEQEADDLFRGHIQVFSDAAWRRDRNGIVRVGLSLRRALIKALDAAYQQGRADP